MAGSPVKRLRRMTETLKAQGIDPDALLNGNAAPRATAGVEELEAAPPTKKRAHAPARARETSTPTPIRTAYVGPQTRSEADRRNASELSELADRLSSGMSVRLERTRPTWAAGWVEDVMIDDHDLASLMEYLRDEHGGQMYRAQVIAVDGTTLYTARVPVSGPPRKSGRVLPRSYWDGSDPMFDEHRSHNPQPVVQQQASGGLDLKAIVDLIGTIGNQGRERQDTLVQSVREMNAQNQITVNGILKALMARQDEGQQRGGLREHLRELMEAKHTIEELGEVLGSGQPQQQGDDDQSGLNKIIESAAADIIKQGWQNDQQRAPTNQPPRQPPPGFRRVQPRPTNGAAAPKAPTQ